MSYRLSRETLHRAKWALGCKARELKQSMGVLEWGLAEAIEADAQAIAEELVRREKKRLKKGAS